MLIRLCPLRFHVASLILLYPTGILLSDICKNILFPPFIKTNIPESYQLSCFLARSSGSSFCRIGDGGPRIWLADGRRICRRYSILLPLLPALPLVPPEQYMRSPPHQSDRQLPCVLPSCVPSFHSCTTILCAHATPDPYSSLLFTETCCTGLVFAYPHFQKHPPIVCYCIGRAFGIGFRSTLRRNIFLTLVVNAFNWSHFRMYWL